MLPPRLHGSVEHEFWCSTEAPAERAAGQGAAPVWLSENERLLGLLLLGFAQSTPEDEVVLLDCGLIQGSRRDEARNRDPFPFDAANIDAVVLSHAHIDHSGRLPKLVRDGFDARVIHDLQGSIGIGHVRYPTAGGAKSSEAQPFYVNSPYGICLGHNGNLTNYDELAELLTREDRRHLSTGSDSEVLLNVFAHELQNRANGKPTPDQVWAAVEAVHERCKGGYAVVVLIVGIGIVAFRDPNGIRPLVLGERASEQGHEYMVASESVALDVLQFKRLRDVKPGETVFIENDGTLHTREHRDKARHTPCIFEFVYFARPDSIMDDIFVHKAR